MSVTRAQVTLQHQVADVMIGDRRLGIVGRHLGHRPGRQWFFMLESEDYDLAREASGVAQQDMESDSDAATFDEAVDALIAAHNRRAARA